MKKINFVLLVLISIVILLDIYFIVFKPRKELSETISYSCINGPILLEEDIDNLSLEQGYEILGTYNFSVKNMEIQLDKWEIQYTFQNYADMEAFYTLYSESVMRDNANPLILITKLDSLIFDNDEETTFSDSYLQYLNSIGYRCIKS